MSYYADSTYGVNTLNFRFPFESSSKDQYTQGQLQAARKYT